MLNIIVRLIAIVTIVVRRILTMARTRPSCCALLVKMRLTTIVTIAIRLILLCFFLAGCQTLQPTSISQPIASTYHINGKTYRILASSKNYQEQGNASWYGRHFHKKRTTSGERYNMYHLTAAHKTLPFNTYVLVTNLANQKKVIVRINDRGPFTHHRLIDLSYAAAKKIGMLGLGTTPVTVKALT